MKYNTQLINDLVRDNYFGCAPDTSKEEQDAIKLEWINCMTKRGWVLNKSVVISKASVALATGKATPKQKTQGLRDLSKTEKFERDMHASLDEACMYLAGAF